MRRSSDRPLSPFLADLYLRFGEPAPTPPARPTGQKFFPVNGVVRIQEERLDATFFRGDHRVLDERAVREDRRVVALAKRARFAERPFHAR